MTSLCHHSKISNNFVLQKLGCTEKRWHAKFDYDSLNEMKELELNYMKHDYLHIKGHGRSPGNSRKLKVMVKLHMVSVDMVKIVKRILCFYNWFFSSFIQ